MNKAVLRKVTSLILLGAVCPLVPAHAVMLEQKWQEGQNLAYQTEINGTANVQAPADANFILAGVPLEVEIVGKGTTELQTLKVDEMGVGTIAVRVPKFDLNAQSLGQKGHISLLETSSKVTMNGKAIKLGDGTNPLAKPAMAVKISRSGHFEGVESLLPAKPQPQKAGDNEPVDPAQALDRGALLAATITQALPTLWPGRDIQNGESWKVNLTLPVPTKGDAKKTQPVQFGEWNLTLVGEDNVDGRVLQRVGVEGTLAVDSSQLNINFNAPNGGRPAQAPGQEMNAKTKQEVKGDIWFDANAGQIARADLVLGARVDAGVGKTEGGQGWADFTGSLLLNLKTAA